MYGKFIMAVQTSDNKIVKLPKGFESRWELVKNIQEQLGESGAVPVPVTKADVDRLIALDTAMTYNEPKPKKGKKGSKNASNVPDRGNLRICAKMSEIHYVATLFDPVDAEWMLYVDPDENYTNRLEHYEQVGRRLRHTWKRSYSAADLTLFAVDDPIVKRVEEQNMDPVFSVGDSATKGLDDVYALSQEAIFNRRTGVAYYIWLENDLSEFRWRDYAEIYSRGNYSRMFKGVYKYDSRISYNDAFIEYLATDPVEVVTPYRSRIVDALAGIYKGTYTYSQITSDCVVSLVYERDDVVSTNLITSESRHTHTDVMLYHLVNPNGYLDGATVRTQEGKYIDSDVSEDLLRRIALHRLKTRDPSLSPALVGLGPLVGGELFMQDKEALEEIEPRVEKAVQKGKMGPLTDLDTAALIYLSTIVEKYDDPEELVEELGSELVTEIVSALLDWIDRLQEMAKNEQQEESKDDGEPDEDELAGLREDAANPLPDELYNELPKPEGDLDMHVELYEQDEVYKKIWDNVDALSPYV